ncbi:MAG: hypothetical protein ACI8VT_002854, partial [Saprospiraceae bacterium]
MKFNPWILAIALFAIVVLKPFQAQGQKSLIQDKDVIRQL